MDNASRLVPLCDDPSEFWKRNSGRMLMTRADAYTVSADDKALQFRKLLRRSQLFLTTSLRYYRGTRSSLLPANHATAKKSHCHLSARLA